MKGYVLMEVSSVLEKIFKRDSENIMSLEVTYLNGGKVIGSVKKFRFSPLQIIIMKDQSGNKKANLHRVVFEHVVSLHIKFLDGSVQVFN